MCLTKKSFINKKKVGITNQNSLIKNMIFFSSIKKLFQPKLNLVKGSRLVSFLFIGTSVLIAAGFLFAANMYYNIDTGEVVTEEIQRITGVVRATAGLIVSGTSTQNPASGVGLEIASNDVLLSAADQVLRFSGGTSHYVGFRATSSITTTTVYTWPVADGGDDFILKTTGEGILSWVDLGELGGGTITAVGNVTSGAAFTSTGDQGTSLWFYDSSGRGQLTIADLTTPRTYTLPDASGTLALGTGTTNYVAYWSATNTLAGEQYLSGSRGGIGEDSSDWDGMVQVIGGDWGAVTGTASYAAYWSDANTVAAEQYLSVSRGGTGAGTFAQYGVLYGNVTGALQATAAGNQNEMLISAGGGGAPSWASVDNLLVAGTNISISATGTNQALIATVDDPYFATSVTSPTFTSLSTTTISSAGGKDIYLDPNSGRILLAPGAWIETDSGYRLGESGTETLKETIPILGFDLPVQTATTSYVQVSRTLEDYPFLGAATGTSRTHKFIFRYSASTTAAIDVQVATSGGAYPSFTLPVPESTDLAAGEAYIATTTIPTNSDDWWLEVKTTNVSDVVRIFQIFLGAYDQID